MTLTFGSWIGIPAVPFVTLYKNKAELEMEFFVNVDIESNKDGELNHTRI